MEEKLTKHELRELRKKEAKENKETSEAKKNKSNTKYFALVALVIIIAGAYFVFGTNTTGNSANTNTGTQIPSIPIHWHPKLDIIINGEPITIPADIGLGAVHQPLHTHEPDNIIHVENNAPTLENMKLGFFFRIWGKEFNNECIFEYCNDGEKKVRMFVNGVENFDFENYVFNQENYKTTDRGEDIKIEYS